MPTHKKQYGVVELSDLFDAAIDLNEPDERNPEHERALAELYRSVGSTDEDSQTVAQNMVAAWRAPCG
jgi:hypothetical protein